MNDKSFAVIALTYWVPPMITIVIGGFFASIILPAWQGRYMKTKVLAARRLEIAESVTKNFQKYITAWKRLLAISDLEEISGLTKEQHQTKMGFVAARNASRDALLESLAVSNLYFPDACADVVESFCKWDEDRSTERLDKLPGISAWREWEAKVLRSLNQELMQ